ncbi:MAG: transcription-repair coupling factor [Spirochaetales bacterium]|nr:MAG: transcription-repair coupling factor [Spirochaetales bacterium]
MITLFLKKLSESLNTYTPLLKFNQYYKKGSFPISLKGLKGSALAFIIAHLKMKLKDPWLIVVPTEAEALSLYKDASSFFGDVLYFPWFDALPYQEYSPGAVNLGNRTSILSELLEKSNSCVITTLRNFLTPLPPPENFSRQMIDLSVSRSIDPEALKKDLISMGYERMPKATVAGEFALRGEVLDIILPGMEEGIRVVFEFDTIEEIRTFDSLTQNSLDKFDSFRIYPVSEIVWDEDRFSALKGRLFQDGFEQAGVEELLESLRLGKGTAGQELYYPLSFEKAASLRDYTGEGTVILFIDYERLLSGEETLNREYSELSRKFNRDGKIMVRPESVLLDLSEIIKTADRKIYFPLLDTQEQNFPNLITVPCEEGRSYFGNITYLKEELARYAENGYRVSIFADSDSQAERIKNMLKDDALEVLNANVSSGFTLPELKHVTIQESEIFGRKRRIPQSLKKVRSAVIDTFVDLNPGDFIVHVNYGIGKFEGIDRIKAAGVERDYIKLAYADEETLFIPIEQVNLVQRYIGSEGGSPRLDKMGGKSWEARKSRALKSAYDLAERLIKLYSRRKTTPGFACGPDTEWQMQFEASFPYEETEDQLRCIAEVKADMETANAMDRLVCGDVGYGKTEIAMRAAFKSVMGGRQVAFLAPTTILTEQHFENFLERFNHFPVQIGMMSRFVPRAEQKKTLKKLEEGALDIIIGTHRILQKDVQFKNLGLLVVDEEQRFGVKDKERIKEIKTSIDCLTLSATPIPRTLHMSLLKIRDMSLLTTPPRNRLPIETHILEFDENMLVAAIRKELSRGGQVFYLHNRIESLDQVSRYLSSLLPEAFVDTAHGQMDPEKLEDVMHRFIHRGSQVLVSTTIIENGIDIPNVNTIIIDRADMYGISQLYQLRGRVGRSDKPAYAYLFYPQNRSLSEIAMKRLRIISDHTALGSGFKIALKDLEVRGAGNLLGKEQSGDILSVGFDMYLRLLDQAISDLSEEKTESPPEVYLELSYSGYIPDTYISEAAEKMEIYKKIAGIAEDQELSSLYAEIEDRFGPPPQEVLSLISLAELKIICRKLYIASMKESAGKIEIEFAKVSLISVDKVLRLIKESGGSAGLDPKKPQMLRIKSNIIGLSEKAEFICQQLSRLL